MKTLRNTKASVIAVLVMSFGWATNASAGPTSVPLKATITTQETLRPDPVRCPAYPYLAGKTEGRGTASHLGQVTLAATDCVTPGLAGFTFDQGKLTLTAANGDTVTAVYAGRLLPSAAGTTVFAIEGSFQITGGTGRFAGATGSGYLQGSEDISTGSGEFDITGTLSN